MIRHLFLSSFLLVFSLLPALSAQSRPTKPAAAPLGHKIVEVGIENGRVSLLALSRRLLDVYGFDGQQLRFKDRRVRVTGMRGALILGALRLVLQDSARVHRVEDGKKLRVEIDRKGARKLRARVKHRLLKWLSRITKTDLLERTFELQEPDDLPAGCTCSRT